MQISKNSVVSIHYTLRSKDGEVLDSSEQREPLVYMQGAGAIIPGLESALEGLSAGDKKEVEIKPEDAYGTVNEELRFDMDRQQFGEAAATLKEGMQFQAQTESGVQVFTVLDVKEDTVRVDGNHPLAGMDLFFNVTIVEVREATAQELEHGHVHQHGHDH